MGVKSQKSQNMLRKFPRLRQLGGETGSPAPSEPLRPAHDAVAHLYGPELYASQLTPQSCCYKMELSDILVWNAEPQRKPVGATMRIEAFQYSALQGERLVGMLVACLTKSPRSLFGRWKSSCTRTIRMSLEDERSTGRRPHEVL